MKKYLIYIVLIFLSLNIYAQDYSFSKAIKLNGKTPRFRILGRNVNFIIAERWGAKTHFIDLYNASLKKVVSKELKYVKDEHIKKIWIQPKQGWIIYTKFSNDASLLLARKLDSKINIKSKPIQLDSIFVRKDLVEANLRTKYSLNEKFIGIYMPYFLDGSLDYFSVKIFDKNLKLIHNIKLKDPFIKEGKYVNLKILNDGSFVVIYKKAESTNEFKYYYKANNEVLVKHSINFEQEIFKNLKIEVNNLSKELVCAGFQLYKEKHKNNAANAFFSLKIDLKTGRKSKEVKEIFTKEFFKLLTGREYKHEVVSLKTFSPKKIISRADGGFLVFAESFYEDIESHSVPYMSSSYGNGLSSFEQNTYKTKSFNYNDIIIYTIDSSMNLKSVNIINKKQISYDDKGGYSSFVIVNQQDNLNVLFLDDISTDSSLKNYIIDKNSEIEKDYLFNVSQNHIMPVVKMSVQTSPEEILIPSFLNNSFSIIKVNFAED